MITNGRSDKTSLPGYYDAQARDKGRPVNFSSPGTSAPPAINAKIDGFDLSRPLYPEDFRRDSSLVKDVISYSSLRWSHVIFLQGVSL